MKARNKKDMAWFYGDDYKQITNKYFSFTHYKDDDHITIVTSNIAFVKGNPVIVVDNNKAVYLKDWQLRAVYNEKAGDGYAVKLDRKYFKPYTFKSNFEQYGFTKPDTFDNLVKTAKAQDKANERWRSGHWGKHGRDIHFTKDKNGDVVIRFI